MSEPSKKEWPCIWATFTDEQRARRAAEDAKWPDGMWDGITGSDTSDLHP